MRAITVRSFGDHDVLTIDELPIPEPAAGQVRVRVQATSVHPADIATRAGYISSMFAAADRYTLGWDFAGVVDALGAGVTGFAPGDAVVGMTDWFDTLNGTQAEYVVLAADLLAAAPAGASPAEASTLPLNGLTAAQALDWLALAPGQTLAVTGAAGAVGAFATELAVRRGLRVLAVAGEADAELIAGLGATLVPRPATTDELPAALRRFAPGGVDGLFDTALVGPHALAGVRDGGRYVSAVAPATPPAERGIELGTLHVRGNGAQLADLAKLAERGELALRVADRYPFERVAEAHVRFARGGNRGRLVLVP